MTTKFEVRRDSDGDWYWQLNYHEHRSWGFTMTRRGAYRKAKRELKRLHKMRRYIQAIDRADSVRNF